MTVNNPNLDIVNINAHANFGHILSIRSQDIERKRNSEKQSEISQGPYLYITDVRKMMCNNPNLVLLKNTSFCSQEMSGNKIMRDRMTDVITDNPKPV